jgi:molecular chaperone GrpE
MAKKKDSVKEENENITLEKETTPDEENESTSEDTLTENEANDAHDDEAIGDEANDLQTALGEAKDKYIRLYSEFENFRRRTAKEKMDLITTASRELIEQLLPVLDDFERAMKVMTEEGSEKEDKGIELIYSKFKKVLESKGVKKMEISPGDEFDDEFHEAITQIPAPEEKLAGKIVDVVEPGYFLGEKVIRFAKVVTGAKS